MYKLYIKNYDTVIIEENNTLVEYSVEVDKESVTIKKCQGKKKENYRLLTYMDDLFVRWIDGNMYLSNKAIAAAKRAIILELRKVKRQLLYIKLSPLWQEMNQIVDKFVISYKTDFTLEDSLWIAANPGRVFLWFVRKGGTCLIHSYGTLDNYALDLFCRGLCFWYDGNNLHSITDEEARIRYNELKQK